MNEGGDFLLVLWRAHVSLPGFYPNRFNASQHIARKQAHCSALCDGRQAMLITRTIPGNLMRLATDTEYSDRIFFAGRLLAVSPFVVEISWRLPGRMPSIPNIRMGVLHRIISVGMTRPLVD